MPKSNFDCFDAFTSRFIGSKVHKLIGRAGIASSELEDLLQEFALDLIQRRMQFDPSTAPWEAFVVVVCENCYATILERRQAEMRSHEREAGSLNRSVQDGEGNRTEFGETFSEDRKSLHTCQHQRSQEEAWELREDVNEVLSHMPPKMRKACEILKRESKSAAARELEMSKGYFHEMLGRALTRFDKAGLRDYLK